MNTGMHAVTARQSQCQSQRGLGAIAAIVVLVMLSALAASIVRMTWSSQMASANDIAAARAEQAAQAGVEWGLYQVQRGAWKGCTAATQTLDLRAGLGMWVTVSCSSPALAYVEGGNDQGAARSTRIYTVDAVACNGTATCPDANSIGQPGHVERRLQASVSDVQAQP